MHHTFDGANPFKVCRADIGNYSDIRHAHFAEPCYFPRSIHAKLDHGPFMAVIEVEEGEGKAYFIIKITYA